LSRCIRIVLEESILQLPRRQRVTDKYALTLDQPPKGVLTVGLRPRWLNGYYVPGEPDHHFFLSPDRDTGVMDRGGLWVGSPVHKVTDLVAKGVGVQVLH
jgi:hypothetical protein